MRLVTHQPVEVVALPKLPTLAHQSIDHTSRAPFPCKHDLLQGPVRMQGNQRVHVIGHDHPSETEIAHAFKVFKSLLYALACLRPRQNATAMTRVQPTV